MSIKRIVHGNYTDPNSTRDITGLSPLHLECLINVLNACRLGADLLKEMSNEEARIYFKQFSEGQNLTDEELQEYKKGEVRAAECLTEILAALTAPFEENLMINS